MTSNAHEFSTHLSQLFSQERNAMLEFLLALDRFDHQRLWAELGYTSLFSYLHRELGMSKGAAFYRKTAVQLLRDYPPILEPLRDGRLCISSLSELAAVITPENWNDVLPKFYGCSKREAQKVAVTIAPVESPPLRDLARPIRLVQPVEPTPSHSVQPVEPTDRRPAHSMPPDDSRPLSAELTRLSFTASERVMKKIAEAKDILASQIPNAQLEDIFEAALDLLLEKAAKRRGEVLNPRPARKVTNPASAYVPAAVRRRVWTRDERRCQWKMANGGICGCTRDLELDHIVPRALGGLSTEDNLRVLCSAHNAEAARQVFGAELMAHKQKSRSRQLALGP